MIEYRPTPAELADWRTLRYRALADAGDNAPMEWVTDTERRVIPWVEAVNLPVGD